MSASTMPTDRPRAAIATARFTVTDDLPTPPLPDATQYTRVSEPGWAKGMTGSSAPPRRVLRSSVRWASLITSRSTRTDETPSRAWTASVTSLVILSRIGHPATVRNTPTTTAPSEPTSTSLTMPISVIGRRISGSCTPASALRTSSTVGRGCVVVTQPCYVRFSPVLPAGHF